MNNDSKWQPIETAPKDGTQIDLWCSFSERRHTDMCWSDFYTQHTSPADKLPSWGPKIRNGYPRNFTHWMPRPKTPDGMEYDK